MNLSPKRIPSLDGLRAISIGLVIISHFGRYTGWGDPLDVGSLGVRVFFVISGFLITGLLLHELDTAGRIHLLRFYFRRTFRIFPAFYVYLACMLLLSALGCAGLSFRAAVPALTYTSNFSVLRLQQLVAHTWSLSTEEQFYLIWPAVLALCGRRRATPALLFLLAAAPLTSNFLSRRLGDAVPAFFNGPIGIGCLLALTRESLHRARPYRSWIHSPLGLFLPIVTLGANVPALHQGGRDAVFSLISNISIALWIDWTITNTSGLMGRCLNSRWMAVPGMMSYSLYLWQQPFFALHNDPFSQFLQGQSHFLADPVARLPLIALCAALSYFLVERPFLRLRARLEERWFRPEHISLAPSVLPAHVPVS